MPIRSMTGYAQVRSQSAPTNGSGTGDQLAFTLSLKSVNHRYLDLQMRMPGESDSLEMKLRRLLKERIARGHVDLTLSIERGAAGAVQLNKELVAGYVQAFRTAARGSSISSEPDPTPIRRMPDGIPGQ